MKNLRLIDHESHSDNELSDITDKIVLAANARPELQGISTTFSVTSPSYKYELDQKKIEMLGVNLTEIYFRGEIDMLKFMFVRGANGQFVTLDTLISYKLNTSTTQVIALIFVFLCLAGNFRRAALGVRSEYLHEHARRLSAV